MHESLLKYIANRSVTPLTETDVEAIKNTFVPKHFRKRQYFLAEGEVCKSFAFIVKGAMRQYTVDEKGAEHIIRLLLESWWAVDRESYILATPSIYYIEAWEETDVLLVSREVFLSRLSSIPAMKEMASNLDQNHAIAFQRRINANTLTAEQRYVELAKTYPEFLQRFPQHIIASYLGFTRETLCHIRTQHLRQH